MTSGNNTLFENHKDDIIEVAKKVLNLTKEKSDEKIISDYFKTLHETEFLGDLEY
jgi:hypothetical protein